jgi:hypothetical protein
MTNDDASWQAGPASDAGSGPGRDPSLPRTVSVRRTTIVEAADGGHDWRLPAWQPAAVLDTDGDETAFLVRWRDREGFVPFEDAIELWDKDEDRRRNEESGEVAYLVGRGLAYGGLAAGVAAIIAIAWIVDRVTGVLPP